MEDLIIVVVTFALFLDLNGNYTNEIIPITAKDEWVI